VSTFYDAFVFENDALLGEQVLVEYMELNLSSPPEIEAVPTGEEAIKQIKSESYDLIITTLHTGKAGPFDILKTVRELHPGLPVLLLLTALADQRIVEERSESKLAFDDIFLWKGDASLFLAMIKSVEDKKNVARDTHIGFVRVILLVEDSPRFYSMFMPLLYEEIMKQTQHLIIEELNEREKRFRMRARPKLLLARNYEEATAIYETYKNDLIAVFSDMRFKRKGQEDKEAGLHLLRSFRKDGTDVASVIMSSDPDNAAKASAEEFAFLYKHSRHLLHKLRTYITENLGFGDFIFRDENGNVIDKASYLAEFEDKLQSVPQESLVYHASRNHFSAWLMARGEIEMARSIRKLQPDDFENPEAMRRHLIEIVLYIQNKRNKGQIIKFHRYSLPEENEIILLADGSLGGKGRGLAFLNALLTRMDPGQLFENANIRLPNTAAIGTQEYEYFIEHNGIDNRLQEPMSDADVDRVFVSGELSEQLKHRLAHLLERVHYPLAVRSSSLLEDSYSQPFAGIYRTYMLPNNDPDPQIRQKQLEDAIKLVYASAFSSATQQYIEHIGHQMDEEKMAVIIQEVIGSRNDHYYYPHISGIAQSYNFYPIGEQKHHDGMASLAVGLGKMVIEGGNVYRFCPAHPKVPLMSLPEMLSATQREFYALDLESTQIALYGQESSTLVRLPLSTAESHGRLQHLVSVFDYENNRLWPGLAHKGPRIVNFENILKYNKYPLANIINKLLNIGEAAMGMPVEIEFALDLDRSVNKDCIPTFYLLQIRPLAILTSNTRVKREEQKEEDIILYTEKGMGNGEIRGLHDIVWCPPEAFNPMETLEMRSELEAINQEMKSEGRSYILIGPGRWGTQDRFLGVPVQFGQISQAKVIVETNMVHYQITPSQGTHFFHNVVAMQIGYFSILKNTRGGDYLNELFFEKAGKKGKRRYFRLIRSKRSMTVKMDGISGKAIIYKE
ncbi:MAG: PEP/pyruvate-binding domain-containing protein, partial [Candidatus Marinimicrobia bacterium]|nr:PEP/pyruvate-binding domain-containing protein [Candidatus Neomarinimicrobiota bacterium]